MDSLPVGLGIVGERKVFRVHTVSKEAVAYDSL